MSTHTSKHLRHLSQAFGINQVSKSTFARSPYFSRIVHYKHSLRGNLDLLFVHHSFVRMHVKMLLGGFCLYNIIPVCLSHSRAITRTANDMAINHPQAKVQALTENKYSVVSVKAIMT